MSTDILTREVTSSISIPSGLTSKGSPLTNSELDTNLINLRTTADSALQPANVGVTVQVYNANLTNFASLAKTANNFIVANGNSWIVTTGSDARARLGLNLSSPSAIGDVTPNTGAFTTLSATGNVTLGDATSDSLNINCTNVTIPNNLNFDTNTLSIDSVNNRVGIGTNSPQRKLEVHINAANTANLTTSTGLLLINENADGTLLNPNKVAIQFAYYAGSPRAYIAGGTYGNDLLAFGIADSEKMRINESGVITIGSDYTNPAVSFNPTTANALKLDASGNVGIGIVSPTSKLHIYSNTSVARLSVTGDGYGGNILQQRYQNTTNGVFFELFKYRGNVASPTAVQAGDDVATLNFAGYAGANVRPMSTIRSYVESVVSDTNVSGGLIFSTTSAGTISSERCRIKPTGIVTIGVDSNNPAVSFDPTKVGALTLDSSGNLGMGTGTFGTSAAGVFSVKTGTAPTSGPADTVQFYSSDRSAGNTIPSFYCEGVGVVRANTTNSVTHKVAMRINGTIYYVLATTSAPPG